MLDKWEDTIRILYGLEVYLHNFRTEYSDGHDSNNADSSNYICLRNNSTSTARKQS